MTIETPQARYYFEPLQGLRALAAFLVVIKHVMHEVSLTAAKMGGDVPSWSVLDLPYGSGVDIFFVLSGFLMVYTSQNLFGTKQGWFTFLKKRFQRIVPLYWFYTTLMIAVVLLLPSALDTAKPSVSHFLQSYLFIPHERPAGGIRPVLSLGWTLNFEMFFYAVFSLFLFVRQAWAVVGVTFLFAVFSIAHYYIPERVTVFHFWSNPIILEFVAGMLIAHVYTKGIRLPLWIVPAVFICAVLAFLFMPYDMTFYGVHIQKMPNVFMAVTLVGALTLAKSMDTVRIPRWMKAMGDSSYTLYLAHPFAIGFMALICVQFDLSPVIQCVGSIFLCVVGSYIAYRLIERPVLNYFKRKKV